MAEIKYSPAALSDLEDIGDYIAEELKSPDAALNTVSRIQDAIYRLSDFPRICCITDTQAAKLDSKITNARVSWERVPFSDYDLKNNYAETKRLKSRIAEITRNQETTL